MRVESEVNGRLSVLTRRRGCLCTKDDFLPEESFQSWGNYVNALKQTPARLTNRILTRSTADAEMEVKARSEHTMKKTLTWWDLMWFGIGGVIGGGVFILTGQEANEVAGPAIVLSYVVSGVSALLSVFCYTEFAVEIPVAGGSFAYLRVELGDFMAFVAAGNILLEYVIGCAAVARSWTSYFATLCNQNPKTFRIHTNALRDGYNHLDPIAVGVIIAICLIAILSTKGSSHLNYIASVIHIIIVLIIVSGLITADTRNYTPFAPYQVRGIFKASAVLFFAYIGFDAVSTMAEETKNPARDIPIGLIGSMVITTIIYCLLAVILCLMQPYKEIDMNAPFSMAFRQVGWNWGQYIISLGALVGMTSVLLVGAMGQARYLTHIARTHMMPPWFAKVHPKTGTPINATVFMMFATMVIAFFTNLNILADLLSISTLFIFTLMAIALLVRRYYVTNETSVENRNKLIMFLALILGSSIATAAYWGGASEDGWVLYYVSVPIWVLATIGIRVWVPQARAPKMWGVPLVPWLPSASIAINVFLLGTINKDSFVRFTVWTILLLVYYVFFGLHASFDTAKCFEEGRASTAVATTNNSTTAPFAPPVATTI